MSDPVLDRITREVVGFSYADSLPRQIFLDGDLAGLLAELKQILTEDSVVISAWSQNREKFVVIGRDAGMPANYYLLDLTTGGLGLLDVEMALPEGASHTSRRQIIYPASDGLEIEAWLTLPPGAAPSAGNHPLIVLPHGGPQARDIGTFDLVAGPIMRRWAMPSCNRTIADPSGAVMSSSPPAMAGSARG